MNFLNKINDLFSSIDEMNADKFITFLSDDCVFTFGNYPPAIGKKATFDSVDAFFKSITGLQHHSIQIIESGDYIIARGISKYTRQNGTQLEVGFCNVFQIKESLIKEYTIYIDLSQLYI